MGRCASCKFGGGGSCRYEKVGGLDNCRYFTKAEPPTLPGPVQAVVMHNFRSYAEWDKHIPGFHHNHITRDEHETREQAEAVCKMLRRDGLGGDETYFPVKTWVEERKEVPTPDGFGYAWAKLDDGRDEA